MVKILSLAALFLVFASSGGCAHRAGDVAHPRSLGEGAQGRMPSQDEMPQGPSELELRRAAAGIVGCRPEEMVIQDANYAEFHEVWILTCHSGQWICSRQDMPMQEYVHCSILVKGSINNSL